MVKIPIGWNGDEPKEGRHAFMDRVEEQRSALSLNDDRPHEGSLPASKDSPGVPAELSYEEKARVSEERLSEKSLETEELKDRLLRLQADFENTKRRMAREQNEMRSSVTEELMKELLPVMDNLERALEAGETGSDPRLLQQGVRMTWEQFQTVLKKSGLQEIKALGETFDPAVHEALMTIPSDRHDENIVIQEFQKGYRVKDRLLRPAKVGVARKGHPPFSTA